MIGTTLAVSVVMPVYNEESAIAGVVADVLANVLDRVEDCELVAVDDGSKDGTAALLEEVARDDARVRVFHQANAGHGGALMAGLDAARGEWLMLVDSDGQIPLGDFTSAWLAAEDYDAVFGVRRQRHDPALRLWLTTIVRLTISVLFGVSLRDGNVPYKLIRRSLWDDARACIPAGTLAPSLFLAIFARRRGLRILELDVTHRARATGESTVRRWRLIKFCATAFAQLIAFRLRLRHV